MFARILVWFLVLFASTVTLGFTELTCDTYKPKKGSDAYCTCVSQNNVEWFAGVSSLSTCTTTGTCIPKPTGYNFQVDNGVDFKITVQNYSYSNCAIYTCKNLLTLTEEKSTLSISDFDNSTITALEPGANMDGSINITTDCVFAPSDITVKWFKVEGGDEIEIKAETVDERSTCTRMCGSVEDKIVSSGFTHHEYNGSNAVEVEYKVTVSHSSYSKQFVWTSEKYHLEGATTSAMSSTTTTFTTKKTMPTTTVSTPTTTTSTTTTTTTTTTTFSTTTPTIPSMTSTHFSKTSLGQSTAQSPSSDGLSKEIVIVIIVVPTVLTLMGIIIISCTCYFKQSSKRIPAGHQHHRIGTFYKGNKHQVLEETDLSYGIHYKGQSNHKETNRSKSSHYGKVKQNPLYRASKERNPYMLYYTGASLRHEAYRPSYTKEHVYPAKTSGYHYGPDNHDNKRRRENQHFISYPGYARHQQYGNPSFSYYMEY